MTSRILLSLLIFVSCNKDRQEHISYRIAGNYQCMKVNFHWSNLQPVVLDTVGNELLTISRINDSTLSIMNISLVYAGQFPDGHTWIKLVPPGAGNGYSLRVSPTLDQIRFRYETGGMGGSSGYYLEWNK
jgi:hypothetical protein